MGRRTLAPERRNQCLDAFEQAIVELGYPGATLEVIARRAKVHRTIIRHYFGDRDGLVEALLARLGERYAAYLRYEDPSGTPAERLEWVFDTLFTPHEKGPPTIDRVFDALYATGSADPKVAAFMREFYRDATRRLVALVRAARPDAANAAVHDVATGILGLAVGHSFLDTIEPMRARAKRLRRSAEALLALLG